MHLEGLTGVSIDKMSFVADDVGNFSEFVSDPLNAYVGHKMSAKYPYRYSWKCADGTFIQWGDENKNVKAIRVEFNPNHCNLEELRKLLVRVKYAELTRCDLTFDFSIDLSKALFLDKRGRKSNQWRDGLGRLETHYIGCGDPLVIRIYNKAVEQKDDTGAVWWRVEAEMHRGLLEAYNSFNDLVNPFDGLVIGFPSVMEIEDFQTRACVDYLLRNPHEFGNLSKNTRTKYKKILATLSSGKELEMNNLFIEYKPNLKKILDTFMDFTRKHDLHFYS